MRADFRTIAEHTSGTIVCPASKDHELVEGFSWDSRTIKAHDMYLALSGDRVDGHDFIESAFDAGCTCAIVSRDPEQRIIEIARDRGLAIIKVADVVQSFALLAAWWRTRLTGKVIAVTGSSGKTTTKNLIRDVLSAHGSVVATLANQNNELGVPATILRAETDTEFVVVEMGMRGLGQLKSLCDFVKPDWALITNVGTSHIELLGSRDNIARAKAEVLEYATCAFIDSSDDYAEALPELGGASSSCEIVYYDGSGLDPDSFADPIRPQVYAANVTLGDDGCPSFTLTSIEAVAECKLQIGGIHNAHNACGAAAVGLKAGMTCDRVVAALEGAQPEAGRQRVLSAHGITVVDDAYNANPDSMRASLSMFAALNLEGRHFAVLGDMGELGDYSEEGHALVGACAASAGLHALICVGPLSRTIAKVAREAGMDASLVLEASSNEEALAYLKEHLAAGDGVLVKASHSMGFEQIVEGLVI